MNHSQVMATLSYLTEVIGGRLTGSPNLKRANEWTRDRLAGWGLTNAHLEAWGPFGRGWSLERFSAQLIEPQAIPLIGFPQAWSPGFAQPLVAEVKSFEARNDEDLEKYRGKLKGAIVLSGAVRELKQGFEPLARRMNETNLLQLANASDPRSSDASPGQGPRGQRPRALASAGSEAPGGTRAEAPTGSTSNSTNPAPGSGPNRGNRGRFRGQARFLSFLAKEGAAMVVNPSQLGEGGTFVVAGASVPNPDTSGSGRATNVIRAWSTNAPAIPPQITLAAEDFNRLSRMLQHDQKLKMAVDLQVRFYDQDLMAYNTVAEIPGTDLKDQIVMLGAHLDSWHSATGTTDNGAGVAACMEAVRILTALKLQPRRTVRIGLWSGEEQGLLGSKAYVSSHFGYYTNSPDPATLRSPKDESEQPPETKSDSVSTNSPPPRKLIRHHEYDKLSAYFNLDNGAGKIRGVHMQGNEAVRPLFRRWLEPFADIGAETLTPSNTGGTDHISFDTVGLPGFQFIQDPLDYSTRTHHTNEDVLDRVVPEDLKQAATILAAFVYDCSMLDEKLARKPKD
jgi:hypothetical protein